MRKRFGRAGRAVLPPDRKLRTLARQLRAQYGDGTLPDLGHVADPGAGAVHGPRILVGSRAFTRSSLLVEIVEDTMAAWRAQERERRACWDLRSRARAWASPEQPLCGLVQGGG